MKNRLLYITFFLAISLLTSCVHDTEDLFDKPAADRMTESLQIYRELLTGQTNGWLVEYYPEKTRKYGGFNLYFRFGSGDQVTVRSEIDPAASAISTWTMGTDMGPTINFDTYNTILHYFSDPAINQGGGYGLNYEGDYEFCVESGTENEFILKGKKTGNTIRMTPLPADQSWEEYGNSLQEMRDNVIAPAYRMTVNGREISIVRTGKTKVFALEANGNDKKSVPFIITPDGIRFYEPVTIEGETLHTFTYQAAGDKLLSDQANAEISFVTVPLSKYFVDNLSLTDWYFKTDHIGPGLLPAWNTAKDNLLSYQGYSFRLAYMWLGALDKDNAPGISFGVWDEDDNAVYVGTYVYDFEMVSDDRIKFTFNQAKTNAIGNIAGFLSNAVSMFTLNAFNGKTFILVPDRDISNLKNIANIDELRLVDVTNPDNWVIVDFEIEFWP